MFAAFQQGNVPDALIRAMSQFFLRNPRFGSRLPQFPAERVQQSIIFKFIIHNARVGKCPIATMKYFVSNEVFCKLTRTCVMHTITIHAAKGGSGRTTAVMALASGFLALGKRVMVMDCTSQTCRGPKCQEPTTLQAWLTAMGACQLRPPQLELAECPTDERVEDALAAAATRGFDVVLIDTQNANSAGKATRSAERRAYESKRRTESTRKRSQRSEVIARAAVRLAQELAETTASLGRKVTELGTHIVRVLGMQERNDHNRNAEPTPRSKRPAPNNSISSGPSP